MLKNNLLEDLLNSYKNNKPMKSHNNENKNIGAEIKPETKSEVKPDVKPVIEIKNKQQPVKSGVVSLMLVYQIIEIIFKSILFGVTCKTLMNKNWSMESIFAIGFTINYILFYIYKLVNKRK